MDRLKGAQKSVRHKMELARKITPTAFERDASPLMDISNASSRSVRFKSPDKRAVNGTTDDDAGDDVALPAPEKCASPDTKASDAQDVEIVVPEMSQEVRLFASPKRADPNQSAAAATAGEITVLKQYLKQAIAERNQAVQAANDLSGAFRRTPLPRSLPPSLPYSFPTPILLLPFPSLPLACCERESAACFSKQTPHTSPRLTAPSPLSLSSPPFLSFPFLSFPFLSFPFLSFSSFFFVYR